MMEANDDVLELVISSLIQNDTVSVLDMRCTSKTLKRACDTWIRSYLYRFGYHPLNEKSSHRVIASTMRCENLFQTTLFSLIHCRKRLARVQTFVHHLILRVLSPNISPPCRCLLLMTMHYIGKTLSKFQRFKVRIQITRLNSNHVIGVPNSRRVFELKRRLMLLLE